MIKKDLIGQLREEVNKNNFILNKYRNNNNKNQWNCICSTMDWITVAIEYLEKYKSPCYDTNDNIYSVNVYTYISCIDMIYEAICQLHRIFIDNRSIPFTGEKTCFDNIFYCNDDNDYFKLIRACFGAHSVNLNDKFTNQKKERRFASWSTRIGKKDYSVLLYSNKPQEEHICMDIDFKELNMFLEKRYNYLEYIINKIQELEQEHISEFKKILIKNGKNEIETLEILKEENDRRLHIEYYNYEIEKLKVIFGTTITNDNNLKIVEMLRKGRINEIEEIKCSLQNMEYNNFDKYSCSFENIPHSVINGYIELEEAALSDNDILFVFQNALEEYIKDVIDLVNVGSWEEKYVLATAAIHYKFNKMQKNIDIYNET